MLPRALEPEVMDTDEDARDYDSMDHREVNRRFVADLLGSGLVGSRNPTADSQGGESDDDREPLLRPRPGHRHVQIPILLCQATDEVRILAADAAVSMLDLARLKRPDCRPTRANPARSGRCQTIRPDRDETFDAVISNSIVHHIPEPRDVLSEAVRVAKPGGVIVLPRPDATRRRCWSSPLLVETYAANCNEHQRMLFRDSLQAALPLTKFAI